MLIKVAMKFVPVKDEEVSISDLLPDLREEYIQDRRVQDLWAKRYIRGKVDFQGVSPVPRSI